MNDYQKRRFAHKMVKSMFNTITGKKVSTLTFLVQTRQGVEKHTR